MNRGSVLFALLGTVLLAFGCLAPSAPLQPGEHFANITLQFES